jgi:hypothetical protein
LFGLGAEALCPQAALARAGGRGGRTTAWWDVEGGRQQFEQALLCGGTILYLGAFSLRSYTKMTVVRQARAQIAADSVFVSGWDERAVLKIETQHGARADLVDILPAGTSRSLEIGSDPRRQLRDVEKPSRHANPT